MIEVEVEAEAWTAILPAAEAVARRAAEAALGTRTSPCTEEGAPATLGGDRASAPPLRGSARLSPPAAQEEIVILLTDDAAMQELNRDHRGQDKPTNVLSFPAAPSAAPHLGDVALAFETCAREAAEQGKTLADHLAHLVAHGVLHLLGWDHMTEAEAEAMEGRERLILAGLGAPDPYRDRDILIHG